jgi:hypothetical protein
MGYPPGAVQLIVSERDRAKTAPQRRHLHEGACQLANPPGRAASSSAVIVFMPSIVVS